MEGTLPLKAALAWLAVALVATTLWFLSYSSSSPEHASTQRLSTSARTPLAVATSHRAAFVEQDTAIPQRTGILRGRVLDAASRRTIRSFGLVATSEARERTATGASLARAFESQDGRLEWPLPPGKWRVAVEAPDYAAAEVDSIAVIQGESTEEILFLLSRGHLVRGHVIDRDSGAAIAAARVTYSGSHSRRGNGAAVTVQDGSFALREVPSGSIRLAANSGGYLSWYRDLTITGDVVVEVALSRGASIYGRVLEADGLTPAKGMVNLDDPSGAGSSLPTGPDGGFAFEGIDPGRYVISANTPTGRTDSREITVIEHQPIRDVVLLVERGHQIRGTVRGILPGESQRVRIQVSGSNGFYTDKLSEGESYVVSGIPSGSFRASASTSLGRTLERRITLENLADARLDFAFPSDARLSGSVTRGERPVKSIPIFANPRDPDLVSVTTTTSPGGIYILEGLDTGEYVVSVEDEATKTISISGNAVLDFHLSTLEVSGIVIDDAARRIAEAAIEIRSSDQGVKEARFTTTSDERGTFTLLGLQPGDFVLSAYKTGHDLAEQRLFVDASIRDVRLALPAEEGVEIRLSDATTGHPLHHSLAIELLGTGQSGRFLEVQLDSGGRGRLPPALTGRDLTIFSAGYAPIDLRSWNGAPLDLALWPASEE